MMRRHNRYVSLRQAAEWGMRALQGTFARLKCRLPSDSLKRLHIIEGAVFCHNLRTRLVGLNQINTVFSEQYQQYCNLAGYDRIARYFENA